MALVSCLSGGYKFALGSPMRRSSFNSLQLSIDCDKLFFGTTNGVNGVL